MPQASMPKVTGWIESVRSACEDEKRAVKMKIAQQSHFRGEKEAIIAALGGSTDQLLTATAVPENEKMLSSLQSFVDRRLHHPGDIPTEVLVMVQLDEQDCECDSPPRPHWNDLEQQYYNDEEEAEDKFFRRCALGTIATLLLIVLGGVIAIIIITQLNGLSAASSTRPNETSQSLNTRMCLFDHHEMFSRCTSTGISVPDCARDRYDALVREYAPGLGEEECDASHMALVALAVATTNHNVNDPYQFFAMSTLYFSLQGPLWDIDHRWLQGSSPCSNKWYGVFCHEGDVIIELHDNNLQGSLPSEIGLLSTLKVLNVRDNNIGGSLPYEIGYLSRLEELDVSDTELEGTIPEAIGSCVDLQVLDLSNTNLTGSIPVEIGYLGNLVTLVLSGKYMTGSFPSQMGRLLSLQTLELVSFLGATGTIPSEFKSFTNLVQFHLSAGGGNLDPSPIPISPSSMSQLEKLQLISAAITGELPTDIEKLTKLTHFELALNSFHGTLPTNVGLLTSLQTLSVSFGKMEGSIPSEIGGLTKLTSLNLAGNRLTGTLPIELGALINLYSLHLEDNLFSGSLPSQICSLYLVEFTMDLEFCDR